MPYITKALSILAAIILAITCFDLAIRLDGILSGILHDFVEYLFTASVFISDTPTLLISAFSTLLGHSITVIILVYSILYFIKVDKILFVIFYIVATFSYLAYRLSGYDEYNSILIVFAVIRLVFHTIWIPLWFFIFCPNNKKSKI